MYQTELVRVTNIVTQKTKYYVIKCGTRCAISKKSYDKRYNSADGISCLYQRSRFYKGIEYNHCYTTVTYDSLASIEL